MKKTKRLTPEEIEKVSDRLWKTSCSLNGLGSLFYFQSEDSCINAEEYMGIAILLQELSKEITRLENIIRYG